MKELYQDSLYPASLLKNYFYFSDGTAGTFHIPKNNIFFTKLSRCITFISVENISNVVENISDG
jgi:hypothetical protein